MAAARIRIDGRTALEILRKHVNVEKDKFVVTVAEEEGPFAVLVGIILSQNTNDKNAIEALRRLKERVGLKPEDIVRASVEEVIEAIRPAGLYRQKAAAIIRLARGLLERGGEEYLRRAPPGELREWLQGIPGIGAKTVDVFLASVRGVPVFAVDTHAFRVAQRWGLVERRRYSEASKALLEYFGPEHALEAHRLVIAFGRSYCRARNPRCGECPLAAYCPSAQRQ